MSSVHVPSVRVSSGGLYLRCSEEQEQNLTHSLFFLFLPAPSTREALLLPPQTSVDLRPSCFVTHERLDVGFVCTVCLAVFAESRDACPICGTEAPPPTRRKRRRSHHEAETATGGGRRRNGE